MFERVILVLEWLLPTRIRIQNLKLAQQRLSKILFHMRRMHEKCLAQTKDSTNMIMIHTTYPDYYFGHNTIVSILLSFSFKTWSLLVIYFIYYFFSLCYVYTTLQYQRRLGCEFFSRSFELQINCGAWRCVGSVRKFWQL